MVQAQLLLLRTADATRSAQNRRRVLLFQAVQNERLRGLTCLAHALEATGGRVVVAVEARIFFGFKANSANAHANGVGAAKLLLVGVQMFTIRLNALIVGWRPNQRRHCYFRASH